MTEQQAINYVFDLTERTKAAAELISLEFGCGEDDCNEGYEALCIVLRLARERWQQKHSSACGCPACRPKATPPEFHFQQFVDDLKGKIERRISGIGGGA